MSRLVASSTAHSAASSADEEPSTPTTTANGSLRCIVGSKSLDPSMSCGLPSKVLCHFQSKSHACRIVHGQSAKLPSEDLRHLSTTDVAGMVGTRPRRSARSPSRRISRS